MASRREQNMKYRRYSGRVNGNLAYDPAYEERQRRLRREREYEREHERQREEFMRPPQRKVQKKAAPVRRQREKVSLGTLCGFMALAAMVALMIMCRAQLTEISAQVVSVQKEISALEDEHVALLTRYEKTFDLTTIKVAAAAAGMAKPSAAQALTPACLPEGFEWLSLPGHFFDMVGFRTPDDVVYLADCLSSGEAVEE